MVSMPYIQKHLRPVMHGDADKEREHAGQCICMQASAVNIGAPLPRQPR